MTKPAVTIVTALKQGATWLPEYVQRLRDGVARYLSVPHNFVCISDADIEGVRTLPLVPLHQDVPKAWGVWYKIQMFRPEHKLTGPCFYIDLDTIIIDDFADILAQCEPYDFLMSSDPWKGDISCSALMWWQGDHSDIYKQFVSEPLTKWIDKYTSIEKFVDQGFISDAKPHRLIQHVVDCPQKIDRIRKKPQEGFASILFCSGKRKPWNMLDHPDVQKYWLGHGL
jgi:hypothetical protein